MNPKGAVEAALFTSAEPISIAEIMERTGLPDGVVKNGLKQLEMEYDRDDSAVRIAKIGPGYIMQLREEYREIAGKFAEQDIPKGTLKTAVTIAYHQPILQSELANNLGARVYEDVKVLMDMDLIHGKRKGQTRELTTTKKFSEYFGIDGTSKEAIRKWIERNDRSN